MIVDVEYSYKPVDIPKDMSIKSCPFCGKKQIEIREVDTELGPIFTVNCLECGCEGPDNINKTITEAIKVWNERTERTKNQ